MRSNRDLLPLPRVFVNDFACGKMKFTSSRKERRRRASFKKRTFVSRQKCVFHW